MKMTSNVMVFAQQNPKLFEAFQDYYNHYRSMNSGNTGKKYEFDATMTFDEKEKTLNAALRKEILRRANIPYAAETNVAEWFYHPLVQHEMFAVVGAMIDMVIPESIIDSIGLYTDVRSIGWGDSASFDVAPRDLFVVSKAGKAQRTTEVHKQFKGQVTIIPEFREITVGVSLYGVLSGKESLAELVTKATRSMETQMTLDAYNAFATAMGNVDNTTTTGLYVTGYSQAYLTRICEQVSSWNASKAIVVGTALALANVLPDDTNYRYTLEDSYVKLGYIQTLAGYDIMRLPQVVNISTPFGRAISDSYLWIISPGSQKLLKLVLEGNTLSFTDSPQSNPNLSMRSSLTKAWGIGVCTNALAGIIAL